MTAQLSARRPIALTVSGIVLLAVTGCSGGWGHLP